MEKIRTAQENVKCKAKNTKPLNSITFSFLLLLAFSFLLAGCGNKFFDPTQVGRFRPVPAVNVILDSLGVAEETPVAWEGAEDPRPIDVMVFETDYVFSPGDIVRISIFELQEERILYINDFIVTETGRISLPEVGVIEAAGLTESQLEEEIRQILSPSILKEPAVTAALMSSQQRTFSILGDGVPAPGRYAIPRYDYRLTDALATAGGIRQFNVSYVYVSRSVRGREVTTEPVEPEELLEPEQEMLEIIAPRALAPLGEAGRVQRAPKRDEGRLGTQRQRSGNRLVIASAEMITHKELAKAALPEGFEPRPYQERGELLADSVQGRINTKGISKSSVELLAFARKQRGRETIDKPINEDEAGRIEWIFKDGKWVPVQIGRPKPTEPVVGVEPEKAARPLKKRVPPDFDWGEIGVREARTRVIKIPADKLLAGDPRYNVVIKPGDSIHVPVDIIGEFLVQGNVNNQGFINITGRPITLKMAIAAAGGLGPLAWPKRCEVIRRIGKNKEEIVMVDLDKIARGEQPDFFIKPNDLINVGTHPTARWRAVLRNAFRATYGFGFIYDRNFADRDYYTHRPIPDWF